MTQRNSSLEPTKLIKSLICPKCKQRINFKISKKDLDDLTERQLINFSLMHAEDHTLVVSIDINGKIRRERISKIQNTSNAFENNRQRGKEEKEEKKEKEEREEIADHKIITELIIEKSENINDALLEFLKAGKED